MESAADALHFEQDRLAHKRAPRRVADLRGLATAPPISKRSRKAGKAWAGKRKAREIFISHHCQMWVC